jgi:PAS domain S-box-containing protein
VPKRKGRSPAGDPGRAFFLVAVLIGSTFLQFLAAFLSIRFVYFRRLGRPWILVSLGLLILGGLRLYALAANLSDPEQGLFDPTVEMFSLMVSLLLASGFALTERWFLMKERLEGRFRLISEVDQSLVGVLDESRILSIVCDVLSRRKGYRLAWIAAGEADGSVRVVRHSGVEEALLADAGVRWDDSPEGQGPTGRALRTGENCVVNDVRKDVRMAPWKKLIADFRIRSAASVRIEPSGQTPMALTVYADVRSAFDRVEMEAVAALAHRVGAAVQSARRHEFFVCAKGAYDDLLRTQRDGVVLVRGGKIVRANPAAAALLGFPDEESLVGLDPAGILKDPQADPELSGILRCGDERGGRFEREAGFLRKDGSSFVGEVAATWLAREYSKATWSPKFEGPLGMILLRDITQRRRFVEDLRKERDFSAKILDIAGVLVAQLSPRGEILLVNRQFEEMTGYSRKEVIGREMAGLLISGSARDSYLRAFSGALEGGVPPSLEFPLVSKAGEELLVVWNHASLRDSTGAVTSVIATGTDVTESRRLERQIIEMQKMEAVGTLAGGVAHDFNNILTGILGNLDLACRVIPPESRAALPVQETIKASERAAHMVRQLLDFSRRSPSERRPADLRKLAREAVDLFAQTIDKRIGVVIGGIGDLWLAEADPNQMHQVIMNLCVNARDAIMECLEGNPRTDAPPGGYRIQVAMGNATVGAEYCRLYPYARQGEFVVLSISDNGAGMDEATQRRIFEPFFTTKRLGRGTGLGLSTVYGIMKQHEGWINLESQPGKGTTFHVYVPRAQARREEGETPPPPETGRERAGKETILLVDDEEMIRNFARQILEIHGYSVVTAADGQEAVDLYIRHRDRYDLVILDLTMPHLSGSEVLTRIRNLNPHAKVILSSGYPSGETYRASAFLAKPYRANTLIRVVREVLDLYREF